MGLLQAGACPGAGLEIPAPRPLLWDWVWCLTKHPTLQSEGGGHWVAVLAQELTGKAAQGEASEILGLWTTRVRGHFLSSFILVMCLVCSEG